MATINDFITNEKYRREILKQIVLKTRSICKKKRKDYFFRENQIVIEMDKIIPKMFHSKNNNESDDDFSGREGDDFDIGEIHRYQTNMSIILKLLINKDDKYQNMKITHFHITCTKTDPDIKLGEKYSSGWLYVVNIKMLIDNKILDYHYISHHVDKYYKNEQHIIAFNDELLYNIQDNEFFSNEDSGSNSDSDFGSDSNGK